MEGAKENVLHVKNVCIMPRYRVIGIGSENKQINLSISFKILPWYQPQI